MASGPASRCVCTEHPLTYQMCFSITTRAKLSPPFVGVTPSNKKERNKQKYAQPVQMHACGPRLAVFSFGCAHRMSAATLAQSLIARMGQNVQRIA